jgi:uncharacterized protein YlzI (FlbEa/FlbD family)
MFINLTRAPGRRCQDDTDKPFFVDSAQIRAIHLTHDYETRIEFANGDELIVQESLVEIAQLLDEGVKNYG